MKWKALAQRKFAQGAYIPPIHTSMTPERRYEAPVTTSKDSTNIIILSNMPAKSLLDAVSFKDVYLNSFQPTVVLDRLTNTELSKKPKAKSPAPMPTKRVTRSKAKKTIQKKKEIKSPVLKKRNILKRRASNLVNKNKALDDFNNIEDNTPLTHFAKTMSQQDGAFNIPTETKSNKTKGSSSKKKVLNRATKKISDSKEEIHEQNTEEVSYNTTGYYGAQRIQEWMAESITQEPTQEVLEEFLEPTTEHIPEQTTADVSNSADCPTTKYTRIVEILRPDNKSDFERRCFKCKRCRYVDKLSTLNTLVGRGNADAAESDIYEFDSNRDDAEESPGLYRTNRRPSKTTDSPPEKGDVYIDMAHQLSHIIQISRPDENGIRHAKLVPRGEANSTNEVSFIEHENLLDKLLATLKDNNYDLWQGGSRIQLHDGATCEIPSQLLHANAEKLTLASSQLKSMERDHSMNLPNMNTIATVNQAHDRNTTDSNVSRNYIPELISNGNSNSIVNLMDMSESLHAIFDNYREDLAITAISPYWESAVNPLQTVKDLNTIQSEKEAKETHRICSQASLSDEVSVNCDRVYSEKGVEPRSTARSRRTATRCSVSTAQQSLEKEVPTEEFTSSLVDAPVFYPTDAEFQDPIVYFEKIMPEASKCGLCKVVAPLGFRPQCIINDEIRFKVVNQYIARLFSRWGPASRKMCAIKAHLATEKVKFTRAPLLDGMEVNLPKLYNLVQRHGGLVQVMGKKRWGRIAEQMGLPKNPKPNKKIEQIYFKYLLPYAILSTSERNRIVHQVDKAWTKKNGKMLKRSANPLHRKKSLLGDSESSEEDTEEEGHVGGALAEAEDCVVTGRSMTLSAFKKIARNTMEMFFPNFLNVRTNDIEAAYWKLVSQGTEHVCVNTASIDTGDEGYGFTKEEIDSYCRHPWNLKMLSQNNANVLRSLGSVLGVTVPTLHLGMLFSTSCWHRDPHGLPWIEYMHEGPGKIWYGIPDEQSSAFRCAIDKLCPTVCQSKPIWLPSDVTMVPPELLLQQNVSLSRVVQFPGEFIIVFPKAYSCSISTGLTISESVYFATDLWLNDVHQLFKELKFCCEPTMFSLERLLVSVARDARAPVKELNGLRVSLVPLIEEEQFYRSELKDRVRKLSIISDSRYNRRRQRGGWNTQEQDECEICRSTLFFSKVKGLTENNTSVCLEHAVRSLYFADTVPKVVTLVTHFTDQDLEVILASIEKKNINN